MKKKIMLIAVIFLLATSFNDAFAQQHKTKNEIIVLMDGYRWKELFRGADSALLFEKKYNSQDSALRVEKYWAADETGRREQLMPFVWNHIAKDGEILGNVLLAALLT